MDDDKRQMFSQLFGFKPLDFQLETAEHLLNGTNVILQAPTGAGKTNAALFPFIYAKQHNCLFADRLIYALPQRTLAVALYEQTKQLISEKSLGLQVAIQTGAMPQDSLFQKDIIFTTIDQVLSAYIGVPVSLPRKTANLPAGAILGAYVVFDEFHLLEPGRALATALDLAERLSRYTRLLLMSATVPERSLKEIASRTTAKEVQVTADQVQRIPSQRNKTRRFEWRDTPLTPADILAAHDNRSIVVVNRVERAQQLFTELRQLVQERDTQIELLLLHSRFLMDDRQKIEQRIIEHFKRDGTGNAILVATQVIEVGLDISASVLHTELAPANSIFQRAGRCARYEGEEGIVYVYALPLNDKGNAIYGPYLHDEKPLVDATQQQVATYSGQTVGFAEEKIIVDVVHTEEDKKLLHAVACANRRAAVEEAMRSGEAEWVRKLIREVDSVNVIIHDHPDTLRLNHRPQAFSINRDVMRGFISSLDLIGDDADSILMLHFDDNGQGETPDAEKWTSIKTVKEANSAVYLSVMPTHAHYDGKLGLRLERQAQATSFRSKETPGRSDVGFTPYSYVRETYEEHVRLVIQQHDVQEASCRAATSHLAAVFGLDKDALDDLSRLVAALHDVGKLADGWQKAIWLWQEDQHHEPRNGFLAHSQFDSNDFHQRREQRNAKYKKPPHAVEGAFAVLPILADAVEQTSVPDHQAADVTYALASAIARHHSAFSKQLSAFVLSLNACKEALRVANINNGLLLQDQPSASEREQIGKDLIAPQSGDAFLLYWYIARRLRIADQQATSMAGDA